MFEICSEYLLTEIVLPKILFYIFLFNFFLAFSVTVNKKWRRCYIYFSLLFFLFLWGGRVKKNYEKRGHNECPQKVSTKSGRGAEGEREVSGRWAEGERQGRGRWAAGDPANSPTIAKLDAGADWCLDPTTMSGEDQRKLSSARQFLTIYEQKL